MTALKRLRLEHGQVRLLRGRLLVNDCEGALIVARRVPLFRLYAPANTKRFRISVTNE